LVLDPVHFLTAMPSVIILNVVAPSKEYGNYFCTLVGTFRGKNFVPNGYLPELTNSFQNPTKTICYTVKRLMKIFGKYLVIALSSFQHHQVSIHEFKSLLISQSIELSTKHECHRNSLLTNVITHLLLFYLTPITVCAGSFCSF